MTVTTNGTGVVVATDIATPVVVSVATPRREEVSPGTTDVAGVRARRYFTKPGVHPYDDVAWELRDVVLTNWRDGTVNFEQRGVEFPASWSENAVTTVVTKYFRGEPGAPDREWSLRQLIDRVVGRYVEAGREHGYFAADADADADTDAEAEAEVFGEELTWLLVHQAFSFNSPVWFNVGTPSAPMVSSCYIVPVEDSTESILDWYRVESLIFKGGAGTGSNLSRLRSSRETLSSGRPAAGPVSFMRGADATAGATRFGSVYRQAAKMVVLDVDHPDVVDFVECKAREEAKIRVLRDAGFDMGVGGRDMDSVQFQNANNTVRVTDAFMRAVESGGTVDLTARLGGQVVQTLPARQLFAAIARAAWECADPGLHYGDTIQSWHTTPAAGPISASNSCSEFLYLDNTSCTIASLNLLSFLRGHGADGDGAEGADLMAVGGLAEVSFDVDAYTAAVELVVTAADISYDFAAYPTADIGRRTRAYRPLGIGYANLGALLMATGRAYDSAQGRTLAAAITSLTTAVAYRRSAQLAAVVGPYEDFRLDAATHRRVVERHAAAHADLVPRDRIETAVHAAASAEWIRARELGSRHGWRNAQVSLLAPTGTTGLVMDCDTMGVEPDLALVKVKKNAAGTSMRMVNRTVPSALRALGYGPETVTEVVAYVVEHGHVVDAPGLDPAHYPVFDCAIGVGALAAARVIAPSGHVQMMAAVQPFLSGAISKTVNLPADATVADVETVFLDAWRLGLKALAIYRDGCKVGQPLSAVAAAASAPAASAPARGSASASEAG